MNATLSANPVSSAVSSTDFASAMRRLPGAVCIVTAMDGETPLGITASSAVSLSADPPSLLVAVHRQSRLHAAILKGAPFAVHLLSEHQSDLAKRFAGMTGLKGETRFADLEWKAVDGPPIIRGTVARFECTVGPSLNVATHTIFTGLVTAIISGGDFDPLVYFDRDFHNLGTAIQPSSGLPNDQVPSNGSQLDAKSELSLELDRLAQGTRRLQQGYQAEPYPSLDVRRHWLKTLINLVVRNRTVLAQAISSDFGNRAVAETNIVEIASSVSAIRHMLAGLPKWMAPQRRGKSIWYAFAKNRVVSVPKGVAGIIAPSNYPVQLSLVPLANALAAGCRVVLAPSPDTPLTSGLLKRLLSEAYSDDVVYVAAGHRELGEAISRSGLDHVLFTGSTATGRHVATATAQTLTPSTLELGGKSPAIVLPDYPITEATKRILWGKCFNAGQTCVAPDYMICWSADIEEVVSASRAYVAAAYPEMVENRDYTSVLTRRQFGRLNALVEDARMSGARIERLAEFEPRRHETLGFRFPPTLIVNPPPSCRISEEEAFGPILTLFSAESVDEAIATIAARQTPLALYLFTHDDKARRRFVRETQTGGVVFNDVMLHYLQDDLPFGGVGTSGWGSYHADWGFKSFSHERPVMTQRSLFGLTGQKTLYPPYGSLSNQITRLMTGGASL